MSIVTYISFAATCNIPSFALRLTQFGVVFFQLALSPSPRTPSEPIPVQNTQQLTLKVEGVVQHGSSPGLFRKIQSVCLNVTSVLQSKTGPDFKVYTLFLSTDPITSLTCGWVAAQLILTLPFLKKKFFQIPLDTKTNEIEQRVEPHNDYFSTQFLLNFSILGTHTVTVEASVVDESGIEWKTGPRTTVSVKSLEDPYSQQLRHQLQQAGAQPAPQRSAYARF